MSEESERARIYLREIRTGLFYAGPSRWTPCRTEALGFRHGEEALRYVCEQNLQEVELLLVFSAQQHHVRIPITRMF